MDDQAIIELFFARNESAIRETMQKYGSYCSAITSAILPTREDGEECINDAMLRLWNAIPPERPFCFKAYLGKIVRNLSLNRLSKLNSPKRGGDQVNLLLSELSECLPSAERVEKAADGRQLTALLNDYLSKQPKERRIVFVKRYFYASSLDQIAAECGMSLSKVKSMLHRMRGELKKTLESEGFFYD